MGRPCGCPAMLVREGSQHNPARRRGPRNKPPPLAAQLPPGEGSGFLTCGCASEVAWLTHEEINSGARVMPRHRYSSPPEIQVFIRAYHN